MNKIRLDQIYHLKLRRPGVVRGGREDQGGSSGMGEETKGVVRGHFGQSEVAENGPNGSPMPNNLGIDTRNTFLACSEP